MLEHKFVSDTLSEFTSIIYFPNNKKELKQAKKCLEEVIQNYGQHKDKLLAEFRNTIKTVKKGHNLDKDISLHIFAGYTFGNMGETQAYNDVIKVLNFNIEQNMAFQGQFLLLFILVCCVYKEDKLATKKLFDVLDNPDADYINKGCVVDSFSYLMLYKNLPRDQCI